MGTEQTMSGTFILKITNQEQKIINYLEGKKEVAWEELAQFAKHPQEVKQKTLQKAISDLKLKFKRAGLQPPFYCTFYQMSKPTTNAPAVASVPPFDGSLVQMRRTKGGKRVPITNTELDAKLDFRLDKSYRIVISVERGRVRLSDGEFEIFELLYNNAGKPVSIEEMRLTRFPRGSNCPPTWAEQIASTLTKLRKNLPELKRDNRLLTVGSSTGQTSYMLV
jgi:hypothetical protein